MLRDRARSRDLRHRRGLVTGLALALATALPTAAVADDGLYETSTSRYVVAEDAPSVKASITVTLRNTIRDRRVNGRIQYYYFDSYRIPVPASVKRVTATSGGSTLRTVLGPGPDDTVKYVRVTFPQLRYGRTRTIAFQFDIPGASFRSKDYTRVGDGYAAFAVQGWGEPGEVSVEIVLPKGMEFNSTADGFQETQQDDTVTWRADRHTDADGIWSVVSARDPSRVGQHQMRIGGDTVSVLSFPGDDGWAEFITTQVDKGIPVLEKLVGQEWPGGLSRIREDVAPAVTGYAWFDHREHEIVLGEEFDAALLYHELTHAWLNGDHVHERWLSEGLTDLVAHRAVERTGQTSTPRKPPKRTAKVAFPLMEWQEGMKTRADDAEIYGYDASYTAVRELVGELDDAALAALLTAVYRGESAYDPPGTVDPDSLSRTGWRRFLDLVEDRAGITGADRVYRTWVLTDEQDGLLEQRSTAREAYRELDAADGPWLAPQGVREAMAGWRFDEAEAAIDTLDGASRTVGEVQSATAEAGLDELGWLRQAWQEADSQAAYTELTAVLPRALEVTGQVRAASETATKAADPVSQLGELLLSVDPTVAGARSYLLDGDLDTSDAWARSALERSRIALWVGAGAIVAVVILAAGVGVALVAVRRRTRNRAATTTPPADDPPAPPETGPEPRG